MNEDVVEAVCLGQNLALRCKDSYLLECLELAVDELLRRPDGEGAPRILLDSALAHARTHLRRRRAIRPLVPASDHLAEHEAGGGEQADIDRLAVIEFEDWVQRSPLAEEQRALLLCQIHDVDPMSISAALRLPLPRVRERLARARAAARVQWQVA